MLLMQNCECKSTIIIATLCISYMLTKHLKQVTLNDEDAVKKWRNRDPL